MMKYPRILIVVLGRINAADNSNNGLLLRNLFGKWPRENLAQIYSSGDNGDDGFFGRYYQLGPADRHLGSLFYYLKAQAQNESFYKETLTKASFASARAASFRALCKRLLLDSGLYELVFAPRLSREMLAWVEKFRPDAIFAQGYNLTFTWLPLMLARYFNLPIIYYPTDDWPSDLYKKSFVHSIVQKASHQLVSTAQICIAFNSLMQQEYLQRYAREFVVLMHGDNWDRFLNIPPKRLAQQDEYWIVSTGVFNKSRLPLLLDLNEACRLLNTWGIHAKATVFSVNPIRVPGAEELEYLAIEPAPSHTELVAFLRGADVLFLPERFDESVRDVRLCISSKAHLFMFAEKPIVVYSDPLTGIVRYAREDGWGAVVDKRDPAALAETFGCLLNDVDEQRCLVNRARQIAAQNHSLSAIQAKFYELTCSLSDQVK